MDQQNEIFKQKNMCFDMFATEQTSVWLLSLSGKPVCFCKSGLIERAYHLIGVTGGQSSGDWKVEQSSESIWAERGAQLYRSFPSRSISSTRKSMSVRVAAGLEMTMRKKLTLSPCGW